MGFQAGYQLHLLLAFAQSSGKLIQYCEMAMALANHRMATQLCVDNPLRFVPHLLVSSSSKLRYNFSLRKPGLCCHAAMLSCDEKSKLLMGVDKSHVDDVARVLELARSAADRWEVAHSAFLTPPVMNDVLVAVPKLSDVGILISGGYAQRGAGFQLDM